MKKTIFLLGFIGCCLLTYSQKQICVGTNSGSGDGSASNPYPTIQAAVNAAANGDIIKVAKGTYAGAILIEQKKVQLLGGYAGNGDFNTANPQANVTILNGTSAAPCIYANIDVAISGSLIINGFTIRNGRCGIELQGGWSPNMNNITIENNIIESNGVLELDEWGGERNGGGIGLCGHNVTLKNNVIRNNKSARGAAITVTSDLTNFLITDNRIENNTGHSDHGGGVFISGTGTITRNTFDGNVTGATYGYGWGGAMCIFANPGGTTTVNLSYNTYRNNYAPSRGGAVFVDDGSTVKMEHELLYNNTSEESGSAIFVDDDGSGKWSTLNMNNCTVSGNSTDGAAMYINGSVVQVENSIFWNNGSDFQFVASGVSQAKLTVTYTLTQQGYTGTGNITSNPLFANAANGDFHVQSMNGRYNPANGQWVNDAANSPAIDAGNPTSDYANEPAPNGNRVNMGCYGNTAEASKSQGTGNKEITQKEWNIFPTPAKENITIGPLPIGSRVNITDLTGRKVYSSVINNEQTTFDTANFTNGIYIVQVTINGAVAVKKFIVSK